MEGGEAVERTRAFIRERLSQDASGHDWWHVHRVWTMARRLAEAEGARRDVVDLAALLHDVADWKFHEGDLNVGPREARRWLEALGLDGPLVEEVCEIVATVSFKGAGVPTPMASLEGAVVQDADRLDAMGALGIARAFAYGGAMGRPMHLPDASPELHADFEAYRRNRGATTMHFHEKLLLLKDRMNTATARQIAEGRHRIMLSFLERFQEEWDGLA